MKKFSEYKDEKINEELSDNDFLSNLLDEYGFNAAEWDDIGEGYSLKLIIDSLLLKGDKSKPQNVWFQIERELKEAFIDDEEQYEFIKDKIFDDAKDMLMGLNRKISQVQNISQPKPTEITNRRQRRSL
jgi:hypothetical protein